jgi:hypothetical protein
MSQQWTRFPPLLLRLLLLLLLLLPCPPPLHVVQSVSRVALEVQGFLMGLYM